MVYRYFVFLTIGMILLLSVPGSAQWIQTSAPATSVIDVSAAGSRLYLASRYAGVCISTDEGITWTPRNSNITDQNRLWRVSVFGDTVYALSESIRKMHINDTTWSDRLNSYGTSRALYVSGPTLLAGYSLSGGFQRSTDFGNSWAFPTTNKPPQVGYVNALAFFNTGTALLIGHEGGIHRSTDGGATWDSVYATVPQTQVLCFLQHSSGIYAGGWISTSQCILKSTDSGMTWAALPTTGMLAGNGISSLVSSGQHLFATVVGRGVYVSQISPINWSLANSGLTSPNLANTLAILGNNVYVSSGTLASSTGYGVWKRPISQLTSVEAPAPAATPSSFALEQNYPNPFNPTTVVGFKVPVAGKVKLSVHDLLGREIAVLVNEEKNPGNHEVSFDASGLASGVYFCRMQADGYMQTRKMTVLR